MTPEKFTQFGEALYGCHWRGDISWSLGVSERAVRRWASGQAPIPEGVWDELEEIAVVKVRQLAELIDDLDGIGG